MQIDSTTLLAHIHDANEDLVRMANTLNNTLFNARPHEGSWTPGQVIRHVTKSTHLLAGAIAKTGETADRKIDARVEELKNIFLDFSHKLKSPDLIVPEDDHYEVGPSIAGLYNAEKGLQAAVITSNLSEMVTGLPFGPATKLEVLHFILFHTKRHVHQMNRMTANAG